MLQYLLDEHLRGPLWQAIEHHNEVGQNLLDVIRVGDLDELPLGTPDPDLLRWLEESGRILVTSNRSTMGQHLQDYLAAGHHCPGVFLIRPKASLADVLSFLVDAAYASEAHEWVDAVTYIP